MITKKPVKAAFKPVAGDEIDKMFGEIIAILGINIPIVRLA